jgi:hypothetical protein
MRRRVWLALLPLLPLLPWAAVADAPTFSDAIETLGQERNYAEFGAGILKAYADDDIEGQRLYAEAKAAFDGLIELWLTDLAQDSDPALSPAFSQHLSAAVGRRVEFSRHVEEIVKSKLPKGTKPGLADALAKAPGEVIKALVDGGISIWRQWNGAGKEQREQIVDRLEAQRWKPFADITPTS